MWSDEMSPYVTQTVQETELKEKLSSKGSLVFFSSVQFLFSEQTIRLPCLPSGKLISS